MPGLCTGYTKRARKCKKTTGLADRCWLHTVDFTPVVNACLGCGEDMGESNPRQFCWKTRCPVDDARTEEERATYAEEVAKAQERNAKAQARALAEAAQSPITAYFGGRPHGWVVTNLKR